MTAGLGETVLPAPPEEASDRLRKALALSGPERREAISKVAGTYPTYLDAWAELGAAARDAVEAYACYRVGYHRGLDALRAAGWRGSGYVRWSRPTNRGFLKSLVGLAEVAGELGESSEEERCRTFAAQLDPEWSAEASGAEQPRDSQ
ncbi:MAG: DUF3151 domain-containing protein [Actinobacteria bacterium]|nr:DUF3151 domain-containing protein [Actinomycetota bacterium]